MPAVRTQIAVSACAECPFFERNALTLLADWLAKREARSGTCKHNGCGQPFPLGRIAVADETIIPDICPLRQGDVIVQLGARRS